jgi:hypothetical protein
MASIIRILLFLVIIQPAFSQTENISFWQQHMNKYISGLKMESLEKQDIKVGYRIWTPHQVVELVQKDDSTFYGHIINFVAKSNKKEEKRGLVSHKIKIPDQVTKELIDKLKAQRIEVLPDSYDVEGYVNGLDGLTYIFEICTPENYRVYSYWSPESEHYQDPNIEEVKNVRNILAALNKEFNLWKLFTDFRDRLPSGTYSYGGIMLQIKK